MSDDPKSDSLLDCAAIIATLPQEVQDRIKVLEEKSMQLDELKQTLEKEGRCFGKPSDVLRLNVGGNRIDVLRRTLTSVEGSMLATRFSGRWDDSLEKDVEGNFFIDQPIELFLPLLNFLRARECVTARVPYAKTPPMNKLLQTDFVGMVEYYGLSHCVFSLAIFEINGDSHTCSRISGYPDYRVNSEQWASFQLLPCDGNKYGKVKSFEVTLGDFTNVHVGWMMSPQYTPSYSMGDPKLGVGYMNCSVALDCRETRPGISFGLRPSLDDPGCLLSRQFVPINDLPSITKGSVIRCENYAEAWYVDGQRIKSLSKLEYSERYCPSFSVKGSLCVSNIELEY
jgi:hypothetical protein